jgi:hypothetical protein
VRERALEEAVQQVCNGGGGATCGGRWRVERTKVEAAAFGRARVAS